MEANIKEQLAGIRLGEVQIHKTVAIFPLFGGGDGSPAYRTLKEALEGGFVTVSEVSEGGTVPELKVINTADIAVLVLDGEELIGAKQNRIVNTTILLRRQSETIIPVSCTEHGRWSYNSAHFHDGGHLATHKLRHVNKQNVAVSLKELNSFRGDQSQVWDNVAESLSELNVRSSTGAMKDAYDAKAGDLDEYLGKFPPQPGQKGLLVLINGAVAGLDIVSLDSAYGVLHPKLLKSYIMEALVTRNGHATVDTGGMAMDFLGRAMTCEGKRFKSPGHGYDVRFEGKNMVGSALVYNRKVIHAAFFQSSAAEKAGYMSGVNRRRGFRQ